MNREEIIEKINLVINKLMNLDMPENEKELKKGGESLRNEGMGLPELTPVEIVGCEVSEAGSP